MSLHLLAYIRQSTVALWLCWIPVTQAERVNLHLQGRSHSDAYTAELSAVDTQWLNRKGSLVLGTSAPDYAPFDLSAGSAYYEGITADYAGLLSELLQVTIKVRRYDSRSELIAALKRGDVDFVGTANAYEMKDTELAFSSAYAADTPVLIARSRKHQKAQAIAPGQRLAMLYHYQPVDKIKALYPNAKIKLYNSTLSAVGAVAFGQADVYLGDAISTHYLINKNYLNNVYFNDFSALEAPAFSFAVSRHNLRLLRVLNAALEAIPADERYSILNRWGAAGISFEGNGRLQLSASEQQWIEQNPHVKVAVINSFLPFTFFDDHDVFSGIAADLLSKISLQTGLKFEPVRSQSVSDLIALINEGQVHMTPAFTSSHHREPALRFTKPYISTPYVLVTRVMPGSATILDELEGKRVALVIDNSVSTHLSEQYPGVVLVAAKSSEQALNMVARGEVEGAINPLITARYLIKQQHVGRLKVRSTVGITPALFSFAVANDSPQLYSILGKALMSISPEEIDALTDRWHRAVVLDNHYWVRKRGSIIKISFVGVLVVALCIVWITYLRMLIRKRDQAERALNDQLSFMRALIDGTPHPIYVRDGEGRLLICNEGYLTTFGIERELAVGKTLLELPLNTVQQSQAYHADYIKVIQEGRPLVRDHQMMLSDGTVMTIYHWILPYRASDGSVVGVTGGWIDISERQQLLDQLQEAKRHAELANLAKSDFLTTMSHEIRTPMNAVIGMLELSMKKAKLGIADSTSVGVAFDAANSLLELIGDILDIAQIESGRMSLNQKRTHLMKLVASTVRVFEAMAQQKGLRMNFELDPRINTDVLIDPLRFRQILSNLMSNAIKFTDKGHIFLSVRAKNSADGERLHICVEIKDTGIGISSDDQARLFSPFTQVGGGHSQPAGTSSGLGLMISRQLCELMGGTLTLESALGKGTLIKLHLDVVTLLSHSPAPLPVTLKPHESPTLNILVVDDYAPNRKLLTQQLNYLGHRAIEACDGAQGLRAWRNQRFDMILTDCAMPVMDGYEMTRTIRKEETASGALSIPIIGFTASAQIGEVERCLAAGMSDCLFKPIDLKSLEARLTPVEVPVPRERDDSASHASGRLIDLESLIRLTCGDEDALKRLLDPLINSLEEDMSALLKAFTQHDLVSMSEIAHKVKSGARMIKAKRLERGCEHLEQACIAPQPEQLARHVDELYEAMAHVLQSVEVYRLEDAS